MSTATCGGTACPTTWVASGQNVRLAALDSGSGVDVIRYTTDGSEPTISHGTTYDSPLSIGSSATVRYRAYDRAGNAEEVHTLELQVDTVAPSRAVITAPVAGATVTGTTAITTSVADDVGVVRVKFWIDGVQVGSRTSAPAMALGHPHRRRGFAHPPGRGARCGRQLPQIPRGHRDRDALIEAGPPAAPPRTRDPACRVSATRRVLT
ncbi:chitobiase/beta-hexosaminidase C-terminal domain-containing protein [Nostocoides veronense]|uniref:GH29D-like beta-sandwich domain-containing protein n=1 Tax=Nostocoides veronense TaxID=330836 RepID=A0ABN2L904_9MICO